MDACPALLVLALGLAVCNGAAPSASNDTSAPTTGEPVTSIAQRLDGIREYYPAPGALALVEVDDESWTGWSGSADLDGTAIDETTTFRIASITKAIVALLVVDASERGELSLDDPVSEYVTEHLRADPPVTIRMLLEHTSGVFNAGDEGDALADVAALTDPALKAEADELVRAYAAGEHPAASAELMVAVAEQHDRYFPPGEGYHYSNVNYHLAAMVLEAATSSSLDELFRARIVEPLGLEHTTIAPADLTTPELHGFEATAGDGSLVDITDDVLALGNGGGGGIISTANELLTMLRAIVTGTIVSPALVDEMLAATAESDSTYGLGVATYDLSCGRFYGHGGAMSGTSSIAMVSRDATKGVVVALNLRTDGDPRLAAIADSLMCPRV